MSQHTATIEWSLNGGTFDATYDRSHTWTFDGGVSVAASSAPGLSGDPARVDPEEAFVASIASCHMMWFLYLAAARGLIVERYVDHPVGTMGRGDDGRMWITTTDLRPSIAWTADAPTDAEIADLHEQSHQRCFIANSVRTKITVRSGQQT